MLKKPFFTALSLLILFSIPSSLYGAEVFEGVITAPAVKPGRFKGMGIYDMNCRPVEGGLLNCDGGIRTKEYGLINFNYTHDMRALPCINLGDRVEVEVLDGKGKARVVRLASRTLTRYHREGPVSVSVTLINPDALYSGEDLLFQVAMNTHTVDLDQYQMERLSFLRDARGRIFKAKAWESPRGGGHHLFGVLRFPGRDREGNPVLRKDDPFVEVLIGDVGGIRERVLKWKLPIETGI